MGKGEAMFTQGVKMAIKSGREKLILLAFGLEWTGLGPLSSLIQRPLAERENHFSVRDCWVENGFPNFALLP